MLEKSLGILRYAFQKNFHPSQSSSLNPVLPPPSENSCVQVHRFVRTSQSGLLLWSAHPDVCRGEGGINGRFRGNKYQRGSGWPRLAPTKTCPNLESMDWNFGVAQPWFPTVL